MKRDAQLLGTVIKEKERKEKDLRRMPDATFCGIPGNYGQLVHEGRP
jgi:hypothetical protein